MRLQALSLALAVTALHVLPASASEPPKDCTLKQYATLPVTYYEGITVIPVVIDDHPVQIKLETETAVSLIDEWAAKRLGLTVKRFNSGVSNDQFREYTSIRALSLGDVQLKYKDILIEQSSTDKERSIDRTPVGRLGMDFLGGVDIEIDLGHDRIKLFSTEHCPGAVVYWADQYDVVPMRQGAMKDLYLAMELDGKKLQTKLATGYTYSHVSSYVTKRLYGWDEDSYDKGVQTWTENGETEHYRIVALSSGDLKVSNSKVMLREIDGCRKNAHIAIDSDGAAGFEACGNRYPLYLGQNVLKKLRLYLAAKERKIYFTLADAHKSSGETGHQAEGGT